MPVYPRGKSHAVPDEKGLVRVNIRMPEYVYEYYKTISNVKGVSMGSLMMLDLEKSMTQDQVIKEQLPELMRHMTEFQKMQKD